MREPGVSGAAMVTDGYRWPKTNPLEGGKSVGKTPADGGTRQSADGSRPRDRHSLCVFKNSFFFFFFFKSAFIVRHSSTKGEQDTVGRTRTGSRSDPGKIDEWGKGWRDVVTGEDEKG